MGLRISASYGLELMVDRGTGCGPSSSAFSARPMHAPESPPVQGTPLISGMSGLAAVVVNPCGEFGTMNGVHTVVKTSSSSPAIACGEGDGMRWMRDDCDGRRNGDREGESAGDDEAAGGDRVSRHSQDSTNAEGNLQAFSEFTGKVSAAHTKKLGHIVAPQLCVGYLITG